MTEHERQATLASLAKGSTDLLDALDGVTEELAARSPGPDRWSILQCAEHVALAEDYLFSLISGSKRAETPLMNQQREVLILARGADRSIKKNCPSYAQPKGSLSTLREALEALLASRESTIQFVNTNEEDLRCRIAVHPILGTVNCHELLLLMAVHPVRHAEQIEEIRTAIAG